MREHNGRKQANSTRSTPSAVQPVGYRTGMVDCWICGAPNGAHREGCFNCGSLLAAAEGAGGADTERLALGTNDEPGRVIYVRL